MSWYIFMGGLLSTFSHHVLKDESIVAYSSALKEGSSAKTLVVSAPYDLYLLRAVIIRRYEH